MSKNQVKISVECPICHTKGILNIDNNLEKIGQLLLVNIPPKTICKHHFEAFVDANGAVRGYQKPSITVKKKDVYRKSLTEEEKLKQFFFGGK